MRQPAYQNIYNKQEILKACERTLRHIAEERAHQLEAKIIEAMKMRKYFIGKHFTREEAIDYLKREENPLFNEWEIIHSYGQYWESMVREIANAVKRTKYSDVKLTAYEASQLIWK